LGSTAFLEEKTLIPKKLAKHYGDAIVKVNFVGKGGGYIYILLKCDALPEHNYVKFMNECAQNLCLEAIDRGEKQPADFIPIVIYMGQEELPTFDVN
jgi:hypothetical protein